MGRHSDEVTDDTYNNDGDDDNRETPAGVTVTLLTVFTTVDTTAGDHGMPVTVRPTQRTEETNIQDHQQHHGDEVHGQEEQTYPIGQCVYII